jgi:hypothetical protein
MTQAGGKNMFVFVVSFFMYLLLSWSGSLSIQEVTIAFFLVGRRFLGCVKLFPA